ncbi:MAG: hypothetical protein JWP51_1746 [Bradyrhizobium sp.]|nr:hypothetical protein [Bradyrhizobium sp.]
MKIFLVSFGVLLLASSVFAAPGDTAISVKYKTHAKRLRPKPVEGDGAGNIHIVLHANGTVDDVVEGEGKNAKKWELKNRKLGAHKGTRYRVIDEHTIERTFDERTFDYKVRIIVDGKSCKADVSYTLHPGHTEFVAYSPELGVMAYYSELKPFDVECKIE